MAKKNQPIQLELFSSIHFMAVDPLVEPLSLELEPHITGATTMLRYGMFDPSTVFARLVASGDTGGHYQMWDLAGVDAMVTPKRLRSFQSNLTCVGCGRVGNVFLVERHKNDRQMQYLNLYCADKSGLMLMTVDHILPDSMGGKYSPQNFQTMCRDCNQKKSNRMSLAEINLVRANIDHYTKTWIDRDFVHALLDVQELIIAAQGTEQHKKLIAVFDRHRKRVKHGMKPVEVARIVSNIRHDVEQVLIGNAAPVPVVTPVPVPVVSEPWYAGVRRWWQNVCYHTRVLLCYVPG